MAGWNLATDYQGLSKDFGSLAAVFAIEGERLTKDPLSEVVRIEREGVRFYVKRYWGAGKGLRRYLGRPRVKAAERRACTDCDVPPWAPAMLVMLSSIRVPPKSLQPQRRASLAPARVSLTQLGW